MDRKDFFDIIGKSVEQVTDGHLSSDVMVLKNITDVTIELVGVDTYRAVCDAAPVIESITEDDLRFLIEDGWKYEKNNEGKEILFKKL